MSLTREQQAEICAAAGMEPIGFGWHSGGPTDPFVCSACGESDPSPNLPHAWGLCKKKPMYPAILTPAGCFALMDAMEAQGWHLDLRTLSDGTLCNVYKCDERGVADLANYWQGAESDRAPAVARACAHALGVNLEPAAALGLEVPRNG